MRLPIFIATLLTIALFLGGCWHVSGQVPGQPTNGTGAGTSTTITTATDTIDTSDWNTYVNYKYGFSFRYPKKWGYITNSVRNSVTFVGIGEGEKQGRMNVAIQDFAKAPDENTDWGIEFGGEYSKDSIMEKKIFIKEDHQSKNVNGIAILSNVRRYPESGDIVKATRFFIHDNYILVDLFVHIPLDEYLRMSVEDRENKTKSLDIGEFSSQSEREQFQLFDTIINTFKQGY